MARYLLVDSWLLNGSLFPYGFMVANGSLLGAELFMSCGSLSRIGVLRAFDSLNVFGSLFDPDSLGVRGFLSRLGSLSLNEFIIVSDFAHQDWDSRPDRLANELWIPVDSWLTTRFFWLMDRYLLPVFFELLAVYSSETRLPLFRFYRQPKKERRFPCPR